MFPTWTFLGIVTFFAAVSACAFPFSGILGLLKNFVISVLVLYAMLAAGVLLGLIFHSAIFQEPVIID